MTGVVLLDAGPLGLATNPSGSPQSIACAEWIRSVIAQDIRLIVPEIADYEVRRELLRANRIHGLARLDELIKRIEYLPITTAAMRLAAEIWAQARQQGQPTAADRALDCDVILSAQAATLGVADYVIATTNVGHLSRFANAARWQDMAP